MGDQGQDGEARVGMFSDMDGRHSHVFSIVGWYVGLDRKEIEISVLERQQIHLVSNFFKPDGPATVMFFYQETGTAETVGDGLGASEAADDSEEAARSEHNIFVVKGTEHNLRGSCIYLVRPQPSQPVMEENMKHIASGKIEVAPGESVLQAISQLLSLVYVPSLNALETGWGKVDSLPNIKKLKDDCLSGLLSFSHSLEAAEIGRKEVSYLVPCCEYDLSTLSNPTEAFHAAMSPDVQCIFERCLKRWMKQVTKILDDSDQIRLEPDTVGPKMEMSYWKQRQARFSCVVDQLRSQPVKLVVGALVSIKSRRMRAWREVDMRITDAYNEAKDNVQYLSTLERQWLPLYFNNPITIQDNLTTLIKSLQTIHTISKYYRYPDRMAAVFVKVTNQLIVMSKCFIDNDGVETIWSQPEDKLVEKLDICINLKDQYRQAYDGVQEKLRDAPNERPMEISEVLVFGRFDIFCRRLEQVKDLVQTIKQYNYLLATNFEELMEIEPKELKIMRLKFAEMIQELKKKPYNFLDHKRREFDLDYATFRQQIEEMQESAVTLLERHFKEAWSTPQALVIMRRFAKLQVPGFSLVEKYKLILNYHYEVLMRIAEAYEEGKQAPPIARNMSPLAGKIYWTRQLHQHMEDNMEDLKSMPELMAQPEARKVISLYNKLGKAFVQYEFDYHEAWFEQMDRVRIFLRHPIICRDKITGELAANFAPMLWVALRDCELMVKAQLELPAFAQLLMNMSVPLKTNLDKVKGILKNAARVKAKIRKELESLMASHLEKIDKALEPGLSILLWSNLDIKSFERNVYAALEELEELCDRTNDICSNRIDLWLEGMNSIQILDLPEEASWTVSEFLEQMSKMSDRAALMFEARNKGTESAVHDLLYVLLGDEFFQESKEQFLTVNGSMPASFDEGFATPTESSHPRNSLRSSRHSSIDARSTLEPDATPYQILCQAASNLHVFYNQRFLEGMLKQTKIALKSLQARLVMQRKAVGSNTNGPLFLIHVSLVIPKIAIRPSLEELQMTVNKGAAIIMDMFKRVSLWDKNWSSQKPIQVSNPQLQVRPPPNKWTFKRLNQPRSKIAPQNYYRCVSENKDMAWHLHTLSQCILDLGKNVSEVLDQFAIYNVVWKADRQIKIKEFVARDPTWPEFEDEILQYKEFKKSILNEPTTMPVGVLALNTEELKFGLEAEAADWIAQLGRACKHKYCKEMTRLLYYISSLSHRLSRPVRDLDDVRSAMATLAEIREREVDTELAIGPVEECYHMLQNQEFAISREELERVDTLRYTWQRLQAQALDVQDLLLELQKPFCEELLANIEHFNQDLITFDNEYHQMGPMTPGLPPQEANDRLNLFQNRFDNLFRKFTVYQGGEELFGLTQKEYPVLQKVRKELNLLQKLYKLYVDVMDQVASYYDVQWAEVDIEVINNELMEFHNRCRKLPKALKEWPAFTALKKTIDDFSDMCPLLELMSNKAMKQRHWSRIMEVISCTLDIHSKNCTLKSILEAPVLDHKEDIEDICISAVKEKDIEAKLKQVTNEWSYTELTFAPFKNRGELLLRGDNTAEIIARMEDSLVILGSLLNNRYNAPFRAQIQKWVQDLSNTAEVLEKWLLVQNLWVYLEAVFVGGDIAKQLPKEARLFYNIDKSWQKIMQRAQCMSVVVQCCSSDDMLKQLLPHLQEQLELCQKSLSGYLEKKRFMFPRFFFVSDPALLEILGQASDSHTIQAHLLSIFDNTKSVTFHEQDYNKILSIVSSEGEVIPLHKPVHAIGTVETWLMNLLVSAQQSLHGIIRDAATAIQEPGLKPMEFFEKFPAQVGLLGLQMLWTRDSEIALIQAKHDKKPMIETNNRFLDLLNQLIDKTTHDLAKMKRVKFETLITIHVHQRDIFDALYFFEGKTWQIHLIATGVQSAREQRVVIFPVYRIVEYVYARLCQRGTRSITDFEWLKQCRFYFREETDKTAVCITDITFTYQNEFLGCTDRLVITPLTDRCYITLAQALGMSMGGCSAGPAGTGKTETVKDMGKTLGKYVVVFNCSDQMDYRGLGRIFKGLVQSGSWGCFDEFNRIDLPVLSVAAQQISCILMCKKDRRKQFIFTDGDAVDMNPEFGIFTTMNPGYAGRHDLPENLKIQFRTVAMMVPDRQLIIRVKLASCGYLENITLARKFYTLYKLCEEQLTKQVHYDFGLRNILSVLRTLGAAKKVNKQDSESTIVMRVLRDMNLSKLVDEDEPLFMSLIDDLFPNVILDKKGYPELEAVIQQQVEEAGLKAHPPWVLKLIQLYETQKVRHGIMILGPSGSGKTCCIHVLMQALTKWGEPHREIRMNPKAITAPQMFGRLDVTTNDWSDGIFSTLWRKALKAKKGDYVWLVLDGPVDACWIENLNSVLDDNKTLTLANGDRIPMSPTCKVLFEPHNIDNASPATVSRAGMVYMSSSALDWKPVLQSWLKKRPYQESRILGRLFEKCFADIYQWSRQNLNYVMPILECNIITQLITLLEGLLPFKEKVEETTDLIDPIDITLTTVPTVVPDIPEETNNEDLARHFEHLYIFSIMWSIGAFLETPDRLKLESYIMNSDFGLDLPNLKSDFKDNMFCYLVNEKGEWEHWSTQISPYTYPETFTPDFTTILVPHITYACTDFLLQTVAKQGKAALLLGEQGTAKTVTIKSFMQKYNTEVHLSKSFNFSSASTPMFFQRTIESYVEKRMGTTFGAPGGKKMTIFIDDINMPSYNEWGDQCTNEILRQTIEMNGFYSLEKPGEFLTIINTHFLAAMGQPGGGRNDIPSRLKRHFSIFNCTLPNAESIDSVFSTIACGYYSAKRGFNHQVMDLVARLVPVTRKTIEVTKAKMLPTPAKFHYVFNLRDLSRIWQGMLGTISTVIDSEALVMALWKHELHRVISDRFTNLEDGSWFEKALLEVIREDLGPRYVTLAEPVNYFVDFLRDAPEPTGEEGEEAEQEQPKVYEPIESFASLEDRLQMFLTQYNEMIRGNGLDLVFFDDAMIHLVRISRIIRTAGGNALLVGVGGSGKQSLTKMASFIAGYKTFQLTLTRSYNVTNFIEDLKALYRTTGIQGKGTTFIFTDQDVKEEGFLEYLNSLLVSGVIFNLFNKEEQSEIMTELTPTMKRENPRRAVNIETVMEFFLNRCRQNLHVVLCFSPVGENFRNRAYRFPGLISGCTVDWFQPWPRDALVAVAQHFLADFEVICAPNIKHALVETMGCIQDEVANCCAEYFQRFRRPCHVTPKSYLSFVNSYKTVYTQKQEEIQMLADRMDTGLGKLHEASITVEKLKLELDEMERGLDIASKKAEGVLKEVCSRAEEAETIRNQVSKSKDKAEVLVREIAADKAVAEGKLEEARPALEEAESALNTIKPAHIATVRKLGRPPHLIMRIMDSVLILFGRKLQPVKEDAAMQCVKPSWNESLKMMSNTNFLQMLQQFPKDTINDEMAELLEPYIQMEDYDLDTARRVCGDVAGLLSWTKAMVFFFGINKEVLPLKANLAVQEVRLQAAIDSLDRLQGELDQKEQELNGVKSQYEEALGEKQALVTQADHCLKKMNAATALITGLTGERDRWTEQSKQFKAQLGRLVGDVLLATAFLSYSGPFNQEFRNTLLSRWQDMLTERHVPVTQSINIVEMLVENSTVAEWTMQGLPNDELSIQNGIIVTKASCYPLLIDPQGQGKNWIKNKDLKNELQITSLNHKYFRTHLEDSLSLGRPLLIEDVGLELDPVLDNLLEKNFIKAGSSYKVMLGDKECDIMSGFMLYMTTKLANPAFTPEISAKTAIIDFAVTMQGLEDQLLGRVILTEKSELESERVQLMEEVIRNKRSIKQLEDNLLNRLTSSEYSLVDDEDLINVLEHTKATAREVSDKLKVSAETERKINKAREEFRPVATRGSILYFLIVEMSAVNYMYQTSLRQFLVIFDQSMARSIKSHLALERIKHINRYLTYEVYKYSVRGFYERHKFLFTILLALKIDLQAGRVTHKEFMTLIKGGASLDLKAVVPKPFRWIPDITWLNLVELAKLSEFEKILLQVTENEKGWKLWYDQEAPELAEIPDGYNDILDPLHRLLLIRTWCPDRTISQARQYIGSSLGDEYMEGIILDLEATWKESDEHMPLICFLSVGSDPTSQIEALAKKVPIELRNISMGQGQEVHARRLLSSSMTSGSWVLLQNCHLSLQFCDEVMETVLETENIHPDFRLWITTESHKLFPIGLLQMSIKFTNEPPQGIKASLKRTYTAISQDLLDYTRLPQWQPLLYAVAFLHTVVQERRKYGPLGWNIPYEFNQADFNSSVQFIQNHLDDMDMKKGVCWTTICYMLAEVQYGGRVTDDFDKRLLNSYLEVWFNEDLFFRSFCFYKGYNIPYCNAIPQYLEYVASLPPYDSSEVFGLHPNADITYQINTAKEVLDIILNVQPKEGGSSGGESREAIVHKLTSDMLSKLPTDYVDFEVRDALQQMGPLLPMNIVLRQEIDRMQRVLTLVRMTLSDLILAIEGTIIMSSELKDALDSIYDARVPVQWRKVSWESSTLGFWFTELVERNNQLQRWLAEGRPDAFWMTGFFNPQGFLTAMRQEITRAHKGWALDSVLLQNAVTKMMKDDVRSPPNEGVYLYGLFIEGAGWDRKKGRVVESRPKVLFEPMPVIHMFAVNVVPERDPKSFECPVYKKPQRTTDNYITSVDLKSNISPYHWIFRGVALLCDIK